MPSDSNSPSSNSSSDRDDRNPNSDPNSEDEPEAELELAPESEPEPEPNKNPDLIDQSLDALENQLASISMSSRSPTATFEDEEERLEEEAEVESQLQQNTMNGSLSDGIGGDGDANVVEDHLFESDTKAESSGVNEENVSYVWRNVPEVDEVERPLSPGSSGYAGEMGSTSGGDEIIDDDEDNSEIRVEENDFASGNHTQWVSGKRHADEVSWQFSAYLV